LQGINTNDEDKVWIDEKFLEHIPPTVSILSLSVGKEINVRNWVFIRKFKNLRYLDLRKSFVQLIDTLVIEATNLVFLDLSHSPCVTNFSPIGRCLLLENNSRNLIDEHLEDIVKGCTNLEGLSLKGCARLSAKSLKQIGGCEKMKELHLANVPNLTNEILQHIILGTPRLKVLNIAYCNLVSYFLE
uniref:Distal membrane arm assembly complex 2-like protein n=1 Tax=Thelazia callipaeda TaxID=103827 RepID=A0A0N5CTI9_THECL